MSTSALKIKIFADGADIDGILELAENPLIKGFTTNPTLMQRAGVTDYERFARQVLEVVHELPVSFEAIADSFADMGRQARKIASWGTNVFVKIPVTNTSAESSKELIRELTDDGLKLNVTALTTLEHVEEVSSVLDPHIPSIVSVFAGRIADAGMDPIPVMEEALKILAPLPDAELLWASPRELFNVIQAERSGCHIITVTHDLLRKLDGIGRDLTTVSLDIVTMFYEDALRSGLTL
ncbi:MAG: transaldolase [Acidimicrobiales bacterium]